MVIVSRGTVSREILSRITGVVDVGDEVGSHLRTVLEKDVDSVVVADEV
jgi:2-phospho-L-lactate transferase/gluconeogenesis factor (CofD/UPF0052 family)